MAKRLMGLLTAFFVIFGVTASVRAAAPDDVPGFMSWSDIIANAQGLKDAGVFGTSEVDAFKAVTPTNIVISRDNFNGIIRYRTCYLSDVPVYDGSSVCAPLYLGLWSANSSYNSQCHLYNGFYYHFSWSMITQNINFASLSDLVYSTCDIKDTTGKIVFEKNMDMPSGGGSGGNDEPWLSAGHQAKIMSPLDGFKQQGVKVVNTRIYYNAPYDGDIKNLVIKVDGFKANAAKVVNNDYHVIDGGASVEGFLQVEGVLPNWNVETEINVTVTAYNGEVFKAVPIHVISYDDFVDEDGDGFDDRTGQDKWEGGSGDWTEQGTTPNFDNIGDMLKSFSNSIQGLVAFVQSFFSFLPTPVFVLMSVGVALVILLRVFGR